MKTAIACALALMTAAAAPGVANARGCLAGAAVGGVAGHFAGRHPVLGAVGGCLVGRHLAHRQLQQRRVQAHPGGTYYRR